MAEGKGKGVDTENSPKNGPENVTQPRPEKGPGESSPGRSDDDPEGGISTQDPSEKPRTGDNVLDIPNGHGKPDAPTVPAPIVPVDPGYVDPEPVPFWAGPGELYTWSLWRAAIAELIASFLFLYIGVQTAIGSGADGSCGRVGTLGISFAFGITIFILVYSIAGISGGHINPAITFGMLLVQRISFVRGLVYVIAQVLGGIAGVGLVKSFQRGYYQRYGGGANYVHYGYPKGAGLVAEIVGTFLLVYIVYSASDAKRKARDAFVPVLAPLAIGLAVFVVHLATIPITGTGINPARSFATAILWDHHDHAWHDHWMFWVGPMLGALLAAVYYHYIIRAIPFRNVDLSNFRRPGRDYRPEI